MPIYTNTSYSYPENHIYKVGDIIYYQNVQHIVGGDYEELNRWGKVDNLEYIVTTNGRVLHISQISKIKSI